MLHKLDTQSTLQTPQLVKLVAQHLAAMALSFRRVATKVFAGEELESRLSDYLADPFLQPVRTVEAPALTSLGVTV